MKEYEVVAAIIFNAKEILCTKRGSSKYDYVSFKYEFPGGKVNTGETKENALIREIREELDLEISIFQEFITVRHQYPDFRIIMHSYLCEAETRELKLKEHLEHQWLTKESLPSLDWAAADLPIVEKLSGD